MKTDRSQRRVVSLVPAATEIVAALGAADELAGISHECDYPTQVMHVPRVTASAVDRDAGSAAIDAEVRRLAESGMPVFAIDAEELRRLAPTVLLTQSLCDVCAVSEGDVRSLATVLTPPPVIVPLTGSTLMGVWADVRNIGDAIGRASEAERLLAEINLRMQHVHRVLKAARAPRPRVVVIEWLSPLFSAGHWTPEVVKRAGGIDVMSEPGIHSMQVTVEQVRAAAPDLLVFAPCGFDVERSERESRALLASDDWAWARELDAWAIDGNALTSRPGPRLADAVEVMASIIAPALFARADGRYARRCV